MVSAYYIHLAILIGIYLILSQAFNLTFGPGRAFNLAHIASYSIGAYTTALFSTQAGSGFFVCLTLSMLLSGLFAFLVGAISIRLAHEYFAVGSLAFSSLVTALLINWKSLTRGVLGIPGIPRPQIFQIDFYENLNFLILVYIIAFVTLSLLYVFFINGFSRSLKAQAEFKEGALALGKDVRQLKNYGFFIASMIAGLAGSLFAYYINYIDPTSFSLSEMVFVLTVVVVGKPGSFWGVLASTIFLVLLPEPLRFQELPQSLIGHLRQLLYAVILYAVVFLNRKTVFPQERRV